MKQLFIKVSLDRPLGCGVLGRSGNSIASWFMNEADLLLVFGASFFNHTGIYIRFSLLCTFLCLIFPRTLTLK